MTVFDLVFLNAFCGVLTDGEIVKERLRVHGIPTTSNSSVFPHTYLPPGDSPLSL